MPKLDLYTLGEKGVDLTNSVIHSEDGTFVSAQNAVPDRRGEAGALTNRDGLVAINSTTLGGTIQGAIHVPLANQTAGGTHRLYIPHTGVVAGNEWYTSTDKLETTAGIAPPASVRDRDNLDDYTTEDSAGAKSSLFGVPACEYANRIYYAGNDYTLYPTAGHSAPTIRVYDGTTDRVVAAIPPNIDVGATTNSKAIVRMYARGSYIYISTFDGGTTTADFRSSVFRFDPITGNLLKLGATFPVGHVVYALAIHQGRLWAGTNLGTASGQGRVYWIRVGIDTSWTLDHTATADKGCILDMVDFQGDLYVATLAQSGTASVVKKRAVATGTWTESDTHDSTTDNNAYTSLLVFEDALYTTLYASASPGAAIRKFDGSSWSTVLTGARLGRKRLYDHAGDLYVTGTDATWNRSADGTTWDSTDGTALDGLSGEAPEWGMGAIVS